MPRARDHRSRGAGRSAGGDVAIHKVAPPDGGVAADVLRVVCELQPDADVVGEPFPLRSSCDVEYAQHHTTDRRRR